MKKLSKAQRVQVLRCLTDGVSVRGTVRITGVTIPTILKLLVDAGTVAADYCDRTITGLATERVEVDEIWSYVGAKKASIKRGAAGHGDAWTWIAIDATSKLMITWLIGERDDATARFFVDDVAARLANRIQLSSDGNRLYVDAVSSAFHGAVDYAQIIKVFGKPTKASGFDRDPSRRYSPDQVTGVRRERVSGTPDMALVSTSYVERTNLTVRMNNRRFTRLTNAFSKKIQNHAHAFALNAFVYNFCRIHKTLKVTPAMAAGIADRVMDLEDLVAMLEKGEETAVEVSARRRDRQTLA